METKRKTPRTPEPDPEDIDQIRQHFRAETSKLDNWLYHRRITEYSRDPDEEYRRRMEAQRPRIEAHDKAQQGEDNKKPEPYIIKLWINGEWKTARHKGCGGPVIWDSSQNGMICQKCNKPLFSSSQIEVNTP
jgi:hypothetical protein